MRQQLRSLRSRFQLARRRPLSVCALLAFWLAGPVVAPVVGSPLTPNPGGLATAGWHAMAIQADGSLCGWNYNGNGQLGDGTFMERLRPRRSRLPQTVVDVASGWSGDVKTFDDADQAFSLAVLSDGSVWSWGSNQWGQLGQGPGPLNPTPTPIAGLSQVTTVAAGRNHALAARSDGTVWAWGSNTTGKLGDGTATDRSSPVQVAGRTNIIAVAAGADHSLALRSDGTVWAWGQGSKGNLGNGERLTRFTPVQVVSLSNVVAIAAGDEHSLALRSDGTVWAWGQNSYGVLGNDEAQSYQDVPIQTENLSGVASIAAGAYHSLAVRDDGTVWAWGANSRAQLGDGTQIEQHSPVIALGVSNAVDAAGGWSSTYVRLGDGRVLGWGQSQSDNPRRRPPPIAQSPIEVAPCEDAPAHTKPPVSRLRHRLSAAGDHNLLVRTDGSVIAWGSGSSGELGAAPVSQRWSPEPVLDVTNVIAVDAGSIGPSSAIRSWPYSLALTRDGSVWAWGDNTYYQLGAEIPSSSYALPIATLHDIVGIAAGATHALALDRAGVVWAWGSGGYALGLPGVYNSPTPQPVPGLPPIRDIAAGDRFSVALDREGVVWSWGVNEVRLGDGGIQSRSEPLPVPGAADVCAISAGDSHTLALLCNGSLLSWGSIVGDGLSFLSRRPREVADLDEVVDIFAAYSQSFAIRRDGTLWAWGENDRLQLGDSHPRSPSRAGSPNRIGQAQDFRGVVAVAAGESHGVAMLEDGSVWSWGENDRDELGSPNAVSSALPMKIQDLPPPRQLPAVSLGAFRDGSWALDLNADGTLDPSREVLYWGSPGDTPVRGDWNGDGVDDIGVFSSGRWFIDRDGDFVFDQARDQVGWGLAGWLPVPGDWNGDGQTDLGVFDPAYSIWFRDLDGNFEFDPATEQLGWGPPGSTPLVGDWNGDGVDDIGAFSGGVWFLDRNGDGQFSPESEIYGWGLAGWTPVVGDWNGDGAMQIGSVAPDGFWFLDLNGDYLFDPASEIVQWGAAGDAPAVADWNNDGRVTIGVFSNGSWVVDSNGDGELQPIDDIRLWGEPGAIPAPGRWR